MQLSTEMLIRNRLSVLKNDLEWTAKRIETLEDELDEHKKTQFVLEAQQLELVKELEGAGKNIDGTI